MPDWLQPHLNFLVFFGLAGQLLFMMRFVAQWVVSEKHGRSVVPEVFWYFSTGGGLILLVYATLRHDPVFMLGQAAGLLIYIRNLVLIARAKRQRRATEDVFNTLAQKAAELASRQHTGTAMSAAEQHAAEEALHLLEAADKNRV